MSKLISRHLIDQLMRPLLHFLLVFAMNIKCGGAHSPSSSWLCRAWMERKLEWVMMWNDWWLMLFSESSIPLLCRYFLSNHHPTPPTPSHCKASSSPSSSFPLNISLQFHPISPPLFCRSSMYKSYVTALLKTWLMMRKYLVSDFAVCSKSPLTAFGPSPESDWLKSAEVFPYVPC